MGKRSHRRSASQDGNNVGCVWGLIRMLYFRRDPKFLLDTKQTSGRHTFREIADRGYSTKHSRDFEEIDEDDNIKEHTSQKQTVKKLMEDELVKGNMLKKIPQDEVQKRLADVGNEIYHDGSSKHIDIPMGALNQHADISTSYLSGLVDAESSKSLNRAEEYDLETVLANFLGDIYMCHSECPHGDCKDKTDLCPSLKSIIHKKLNDLNNPDCNLGYEHPQESKGDMLLDENGLSNSKAAQSKEFKDALEILSSNKDLFLNLLQKPNSHILDNIQKHQHSRLTTKLEPDKIIGQTSLPEETRSTNHHELATTIRAQGKESKHMFFWRKDKSNRKQIPEGTNRSHPVSKIVILKPNPGRDIDQAVINSARSLNQQPCTLQSPEYSGRESSKFLIKEIRRKFRIVTGESRRQQNAVPADDLQRWLQDTATTTKKDSRDYAKGILVDKSLSSLKNARSLTSNKEKQLNGSQGKSSGGIVASKGASNFYKEAKKHLKDIFKDNNQSVTNPTVQISKSLEGMLSLPHCNVSSPTSNPREKEHLDLSPEEAGFELVSMVDREESAQEISQSHANLESIAYCTSAEVDQMAVQEEYCMKEESQEGTRGVTDVIEDTKCIEETNKLDNSEIVCNVQCIEAELLRNSPQPEMLEETEQGTEPVQMFLNSPVRVVEKAEQKDPETPELRDLTKLISHVSPEQSNEKQEQPSPISVLDSFYKDVSSPDNENTKECEQHEDLCGTLYFSDNESDVKAFWEDKNTRLDYIKLVLELSELCVEQNLEVWYLEDELISPCLLEELHNQGDEIDDLKLLFDFICEALTEIQERYFRLSSWLSFLKHDIRTPPVGENLIPEVEKYVDGYLQHSFPCTLDQIMKRDLEIQTWMDIRSKTEGIVVEIWEFVLDELIDETVFDLWI